MLHVYGIKNCNTVKKALDYLGEKKIEYVFHDFKKEGVSKEKLQSWETIVDWEKLVNKKGTTWKKLTDSEKATVVDADSANQILISNTSMIKRPVIEYSSGILLGFDQLEYDENLK
ncbi:Spx/MgsR family RNA polymerase-binding regulatory protein [Sphingobacterium sp. SYP-B4668]|uniref:Spx/MgsR family RNA polymerase-binding regulatory protein n=1 Tax=Sphingobacterium sp. SYP-B4668 TaxID=2996035 RepID=UPI0005325C94|nr:Spx/MgsR family RNA polymerase-binding regulatory protein [Sphingobacterium sp. SYP-B4668]